MEVSGNANLKNVLDCKVMHRSGNKTGDGNNKIMIHE